MTEATSPAPRKKNNSWIWFFVFIVVASVGVAAIMIWFNVSIQLTPAALEAAKKRWQDANIQDYNLVYKKRLNAEERAATFFVKVRGGKAQEVTMNGKPLQKEDENDPDPRPFHSMDSQFRYLERFMELDQKPKAPKVYFVASFDPQTGAILHYIRSDSQKKQRVEMEFVLTPIEK
jgi:Family of unknown function (DUF6174)